MLMLVSSWQHALVLKSSNLMCKISKDFLFYDIMLISLETVPFKMIFMNGNFLGRTTTLTLWISPVIHNSMARVQLCCDPPQYDTFYYP